MNERFQWLRALIEEAKEGEEKIENMGRERRRKCRRERERERGEYVVMVLMDEE